MWVFCRTCFALALVALLGAGCGGPSAPTGQTGQPVATGLPVVEEFLELDGERFPVLANLGPPPIPADNPQTVDANGWPLTNDPKVQLGGMLFFDSRLSGDSSVSCGTCHVPGEGWGLNSTISRGYPGTTHWRNSPTAINSAYMWKLFWDGSAKSLEPQAKKANTGGVAGNAKTDIAEERLRQSPEYVRRFKEVFGTDIPLLEDAWMAIGAFERVLLHTDSPFDDYLRGDREALDEQQIRGLALFEGKANCIKCHNGSKLSNEKYYNLGLPQQTSFLDDPMQQITHRFEYAAKGITEELYRKGKIDLGLYFTSKRKEDIGKFRVQPLRYIFFTPPYMHNGVFDTLEEVVDFYNDGGGDDAVLETFGIANKTKVLEKLELTDDEKDDLVAFLDSFTGDPFVIDLPPVPDSIALVYQGETYVGLPVPVVIDNLEARAAEAAKGSVNWTLVSGPPGATVDSDTGRITWANAQPQSGGDLVAFTIRSQTPDGTTDEQTLRVSVSAEDPPNVYERGTSR